MQMLQSLFFNAGWIFSFFSTNSNGNHHQTNNSTLNQKSTRQTFVLISHFVSSNRVQRACLDEREENTAKHYQCCCVPCQVMSLQFVSIMSKGSWSMRLHQHQLQLSAYTHFTVKALHLLTSLEVWNGFCQLFLWNNWRCGTDKTLNFTDKRRHSSQQDLNGLWWCRQVSKCSHHLIVLQVLTHHAKLRDKAISSCWWVGSAVKPTLKQNDKTSN